ncbi:MmgE/PrpD family protein [Acuticoccus mangrovi]|uniref:MmgE/PrpD family protein n=1 Tax=Acuticoccus mangrovi TaxID=2796142 RepID=A0A934IQF2_9HYPH|nr:MmgE/PrpD family protein [Acuticoccus mangrovi]MBJ3776723.1 MmgE/PrpD family protein [Acuticoccus mangrovi]
MADTLAGRPTVISALAAWADATRAFGPLARQRARDAVVDTVGCIVAGAAEPATAMVRDTFGGESGRHAVVGGCTAAPGHAALVNATSAHALDFDDTFRPLMGHASAVLVPALLAAAEHRGIAGSRLLDGYVVGLEAQATVGALMNPDHYAAGWHATSTVGLVGAAAGVAHMLGLDGAGIGRAMSLACSMTSGIKGQFGTPAKPLHAGLCACNAVEAALMAAAGLTGRSDIVEHNFGFRRLYAGNDTPAAPILAAIGGAPAIETVGLTPKRFPCCAATHKVLDMVLDLAAVHHFPADAVVAVDALVGSINAGNLPYTSPVDETQARFSMNFCVALALRQGKLRVGDFTRDTVLAPDIQRLMPRVTMCAYTADEERETRDLPHKVAIRLADGRTLAAERLMQKGTIAEPFDDGARRDKFLDCASGHMDGSAAERFLGDLEAIAAMPDVTPVAQALAAVR